MSADRPAPLRGYIMPLLTPFNADGSVDEQGMRTNIAYLIGEGIHGITLTGSFGEFPLLTEQERIRLYEVAVEEAAGRCAVIAGTAHARTDIVIELGDAAARVGMDGVMMTPPPLPAPLRRRLALAFRPHRGRVQAAGDDLQQPAAGGHQHVSVPAGRAEPARQRGDHQAVQPGPHGADRPDRPHRRSGRLLRDQRAGAAGTARAGDGGGRQLRHLAADARGASASTCTTASAPATSRRRARSSAR